MDVSAEIYPRRYEKPRTIGGKFLWLCERNLHNLRHFLLRNKFSIDVVFIMVYFIEQAFFVYSIHKGGNELKKTTYFVLVLLSTMAIERVLMELRYSTLREHVGIKISGLKNQVLRLFGSIADLKEKLEMVRLRKTE